MSQTTAPSQNANAFADVQIYSGAELAVQQNQVQQGGALASSDQQRAIAEVQAALVIAASRPRNEVVARDKLMRACQRSRLAEGATYAYERGRQSVTGPSIRLAEAAARTWGNMNYGFRELSRQDGSSECEAFAWDLETNTKAVRQFTVRHKRDAGGSSKDVKTERDIYEVIAANAQRRVRAAILEIVPGDIIEDAVAECEKTMKAGLGNKPLKDVVNDMLKAFSNFGIDKKALEERLGCRLDAAQPAQIMALRRIYASLNDGMSEASDWFNIEQAAPNPTTVPQSDACSTPSAAPAPESASTPAPSEQSAPAQPAQDQPQGYDDANEPFECSLDKGRMVTEVDCEACARRSKCPEWGGGEQQ